MSSEWNFGDSFPSIEIDTEYWRSLKMKEKFKYLLRLVFQEKDLGNRMNMINYIMSNVAKVGKAFIRNKEMNAYLDIMENSTNLISVSAAVGNIFKAKQKYRHTKNNEIAKLMGFPNGNYVDEKRLEITQSMAEAFIDMSDYHKDKYKIKVDHVQNDDKDKKPSSDDAKDEETTSIIKNIKMAGTIDEDETKWGLSIKTIGNVIDDEEDSTHTATCKIYYPVSGMKIHPDALKDKLQKIMYELYIDKVDTHSNYVKVKGTKLEICERKDITENIRNIDIPKITRAITKTLDEGSRRGIVFVGEPGVGKTIALHKTMNNFRDRLIFWVTPDSINSITGIRNVFNIFKMFKSSIIIFDDLDGADLTTKDEKTVEFLAQLDGTSNLTGFLIAAVNDPSKIHMTVINRPERFDDVFLVDLPTTDIEIIEIIFSKANEKGYYEKKDKKNHFNAKGTIDFAQNSKPLSDLCKKIIKGKFTQVQVAGLISDCHMYTETKSITIKALNDAVETRLKSIENSMMKATKGKLSVDFEELSPEAMANMTRKR
jgi:ATP-dependent 26S proteasome regulatory subunit